MRLRLPQTLLLFAFPIAAFSDGAQNQLPGIEIRAACVESLKGVGSASIIFDMPTRGDVAGSGASNNEFNWNAQLVTESGQIVRVQLHCVKAVALQPQDKETEKQAQRYVSELVRL